MTMPRAIRTSPSPATREREGPSPKGWEGEGLFFAASRGIYTLTRLAALATLSRVAGEGR